ncbi:MAG TPA: organic hydroperoxide resistance protein [Patescibacteria group bacterium]|nr:organic hydroperoxide resistance protein [Patescibacteria group bacterium]
MTVLYTARANVTGGRDGAGETDDGKLSVKLSRPGPGGAGTNPEQLFAIGYAACFGGALGFVAGQKKLETGAITIQNEVTLNQDDKGFSLGVTLNVLLPAMEKAEAEELVKEADKVCPYSKALRGNVPVVLKVNGNAIG